LGGGEEKGNGWGWKGRTGKGRRGGRGDEGRRREGKEGGEGMCPHFLGHVYAPACKVTNRGDRTQYHTD